MPLFSKFKSKGAQPAPKSKDAALPNGNALATKPRYVSTWNSKAVEPEEVQELIHLCTVEMKSRAEALDAPFLLIPFRPDSDPSGARSFIRNFYHANKDGSAQYRGASLQQELRLTEAIVLCSILKWCWSRMPGGVVSWAVYEGFQIGEKESNLARNAFDTFIPISADSSARQSIIFDFYDLMMSVAARGKMNGLGGRKLSRLAGWWAFEHSDNGKGFEGGYKSWTAAADASSHLFFAFLRSRSPEEHPSMSLIERIPRSLQALLASTEYPPETPTLMQKSTPRVVMMVDSVSPTPFALLRRAKHFEFRDNDRVLRAYSEFEDPVDALTDECKRVLFAVSSTNSSAAKSRHRNIAKPEESWSAFSNLGFADMDENALQKTPNGLHTSGSKPTSPGLRSEPRSRNADHARPTTPSWAEFLSSGFAEDDANKPSTTLLLPPDKVLPPLGSRAQTPSYIPDDGNDLAPGELAAIANVELDDAFWWVWMTSLAVEEPAERKAVFGRCAVIETTIMNGRWLIMEEQVKGASPDPEVGVYIAKKKSFFSFTKRGKLTRKRSTNRPPTSPLLEQPERTMASSPSRSSLAPDQQSKIKQAAAALKRQDYTKEDQAPVRRGRHDEGYSSKTQSTLTTGLQSEAGPAMKWTNAYDKSAIRAHYLGDAFAGTGASRENILPEHPPTSSMYGDGASSVASPVIGAPQSKADFPAESSMRDLPPVPQDEQHAPATTTATAVTESEPAPVAEPEEALASSMSATAPEYNEPHAEKEPAKLETEKEAVPKPISTDTANAFDKEIGGAAPSSPRRKPVPSADYSHPAYRPTDVQSSGVQPQTPTSPAQNAATIAAQRAMGSNGQTSPDTAKDGNSKLKKQSGGGGFKKLFSRKKDTTNRQSVEYTRTNANTLSPVADPKLNRRTSLLRKKNEPAASQQHSEADEPQATPSELEGDPVMPHSHGSYANSDANISHADSADPQNADAEFARFDQGPVDMPSGTPHDSQPELIAPQARRNFNVNQHFADQVHSQEDIPVSKEADDPIEDNDAQSETTMDEVHQTTSEKDRWATIRENAARRAARASEDQSSQTRRSQSVDDGETSGEETIESRVARIKARVAELTGGMDATSAARR